MSGIMLLERYKLLYPDAASGVSDEVLRHRLAVVQAIAEGISSLSFGSEIHAVEAGATEGQYNLHYSGGLYVPGMQVRLFGGGVSSSAFTVLDVGGDGLEGWIVVASEVAIEPTFAMPIEEAVGTPHNGFIECRLRPVFQVVEVRSRRSDDILFSDESVDVLDAADYEIERKRGLGVGVRVRSSVVPMSSLGGRQLLKRHPVRLRDSVQVRYASGFYRNVPGDLEAIVGQIATEVVASTSGVFASESHDYYSYTRMDYEQIKEVPYSAIAVLRAYSNL